jgi:hypothetical protein
MMNIKTIWFYTALAACLGGGYGAGVAVSPSQNELAQALKAAQIASLNSCTEADKGYRYAPTRNSNPKTYKLD